MYPIAHTIDGSLHGAERYTETKVSVSWNGRIFLSMMAMASLRFFDIDDMRAGMMEARTV